MHINHILSFRCLIAGACWLGVGALTAVAATNLRVTPPENAQPPAPKIEAQSSLEPSVELAPPVASGVSKEPTSSTESDAPSSINETAPPVDTPPAGSADEQPADTQPASARPSKFRELSVEPGTSPLLPADRPAWVGAPADYSSDIHRLYVGSLVSDARQDVDRNLELPLQAALNEYVETQVLHQPDAARELADHLTPSYIRMNLIDDPQGFVAELNTAEGPMYQKWVAVTITPAQRTQIEAWHREALQRQRLGAIGLGALGVIGVLSLAHLGLRRRFGAAPSVSVPTAVDAWSQETARVGSQREAGQMPAAASSKRRRPGFLLGLFLGVLALPVLASMILYSSVREHEHAQVQYHDKVEIEHGLHQRAGEVYDRHEVFEAYGAPPQRPRPPAPPKKPRRYSEEMQELR